MQSSKPTSIQPRLVSQVPYPSGLRYGHTLQVSKLSWQSHVPSAIPRPPHSPHSSVSFVGQSGSISKQSTIKSPSVSKKSSSPGHISSLSHEPSLSESS